MEVRNSKKLVLFAGISRILTDDMETCLSIKLETDLHLELNRLKTFRDWPHKNLQPIMLARAGFYHIAPLDRVKCFNCQMEIENWTDNENCYATHWIMSPECNYILQRLRRSGPQTWYNLALVRLRDVKSVQNATTQTEIIREINPAENQNLTAFNDTTTITNTLYQLLETPSSHKFPAFSTPSSTPIQQPDSSSLANMPHALPPITLPPAIIAPQMAFKNAVRLPRFATINTCMNELLHNKPHISITMILGTKESKHKQFSKFSERAKTFMQYSVLFVYTRNLAHTGFFATGNEDECLCYECGCSIKNWKSYDVPWKRHYETNPLCKYLELFILRNSAEKKK